MATIALISGHVFANPAPEGVDNTRLFVKLKSGANIEALGFGAKAKLLYNNLYVVTSKNAAELEASLKGSNLVAYTQKNFKSGSSKLPSAIKLKSTQKDEVDPLATFNDPKVGRIWSFLDKERHGVSVNRAYEAPVSAAAEDIIVAVVDTGVDYNHEDLKAIMWSNENEIAGNGLDDDQNGYVDDVHGINTLVRNADGTASGNPMASHAHGTHVAGTIAAAQNNSVGIAGIASRAKIMAIRTVPDDSDETDADVVESFLYAAKHGAKLINCSFGKRVNEGGMIVSDTIEHIGQTYGTLVVAAAGNDYGQDIDVRRTYPASFETEYLMVIASTSNKGVLSFFSNVGVKSVDVAAPGSDIFSTVPGNDYANMSGTSMATPTTVGVAAEVLAHNPSLSPLELKKVLMDSVTKVKSFEGKVLTAGRVDLKTALELAKNRR